MEMSQAADVKDPPDLDSTSLYTNRELSWLDFNERVLELAEDRRTPLMERVKFLAIYSTNLDEFEMVRVAGLHDQVDAGIDVRKADGLSPLGDHRAHLRAPPPAGRPPLRACGPTTSALRWPSTGIRVVAPEGCSSSERKRMDALFNEQIFPVLTPLAVGPGRPFPYISNLSLSIGGVRARPGERHARVRAREGATRGAAAAIDVGDGAFVPLECVIARHLDSLFPGMEVEEHDVLPRDPRRRLRGLRRGRRPAARGGGRAARAPLRRGGAAGGQRRHRRRAAPSSCSSRWASRRARW